MSRPIVYRGRFLPSICYPHWTKSAGPAATESIKEKQLLYNKVSVTEGGTSIFYIRENDLDSDTGFTIVFRQKYLSADAETDVCIFSVAVGTGAFDILANKDTIKFVGFNSVEVSNPNPSGFNVFRITGKVVEDALLFLGYLNETLVFKSAVGYDSSGDNFVKFGIMSSEIEFSLFTEYVLIDTTGIYTPIEKPNGEIFDDELITNAQLIKNYIKEQIIGVDELFQLIDNDETRIFDDFKGRETLPEMPLFYITLEDMDKIPLEVNTDPIWGILSTIKISYITTKLESAQAELQRVDQLLFKEFKNDRTFNDMDCVIKTICKKSSVGTGQGGFSGSDIEMALTFPIEVLYYADD